MYCVINIAHLRKFLTYESHEDIIIDTIVGWLEKFPGNMRLT